MMKCKVDFPKILIFLIGFFSTFELTRCFGVTIFSWLLLLFSIYMIIHEKKVYTKSGNAYIWIYLGIATISELMIFTIELTNKNSWIVSSAKKYVLLLALICSFLFISVTKNGKEIFIKGLYYSCLVEMSWCYIQLVLYKFAGMDINKIIFGISHLSPINGKLVLSGLNTNAGILAPALFFLILVDKRLVVKILALILFFISGTSTMIVCGMTILFVICAYYAFKKLTQTKPSFETKTFIVLLFVLVAIFLTFALKPDIIQKLGQNFVRLFSRLSDAKNAKFTDGSTFTHTRYYTSIFHVLNNSKFLNDLFGYGIGCAGVPFVQIFEQYSDMIYVPESDPITFLYNYGIIGFIFIYSMITYVILRGRKIEWRYSAFFISVLIGGIFYGMYLNWVFMLTWIVIESVHEKKCIFDI